MPYAEPLTEDQLTDALGRLPEWGRDGASLTRTVEVGGFTAAVRLVNQVAGAAAAAHHHPDVCIHDYKKVTITQSTHAAGAITARDTELAEQIDRLVP